MTEQNPPTWMDGTTVPGDVLRRMTQAIMGPGIARLGDLAVTEHAGTPNMSVDVAAGGAFVAGTSGTYQGTYFVENRGIVVKTIATAHPTNPRIDLVCARVRENAIDSSGVSAWDIHVVTGTPGAVPVAPTVPANSMALATINIPATDTAITNSQITSLRSLARPWNSAWGELAIATKTSATAGITGIFTVPGLSVTASVAAGRRIRTTVEIGEAYQSVATGYVDLSIRDGSFTGLRQVSCRLTNSEEWTPTISHTETTSVAGTVTRVAALAASAGNVSVQASALLSSHIRIEDVGPA